MSLFDATIPANTEAVKLGAQRFRELKGWLNSTLGAIFSDTVPTWVANIIPGASLVNASVTATQVAADAITTAKIIDGAVTSAKFADGAITTAKLAAGAVTAAKTTPDAYFYAAGTFAAGNYVVTLSPLPAAWAAGVRAVFKASAANTGSSTTAGFSSGVSSITVGSATGIAIGQAVTGTNIAAGTTVSSVSGTTIGLSLATTGVNDGGTYRFFGSTRLTVPGVGGATTATTTATFIIGAGAITVGSVVGITVGSTVAGTNIAAGTTVTSITGTSVSISAVTTGASSGSYTFSGAQVILKNGGAALALGDIASGQIVEVIHDGTNLQMVNPPATALTSTGTSYSGVAKAWVRFGISGGFVTVIGSYNVTSVTRNAASDYTVNFTTAFADTNFAVSLGSKSTGTATAVAGGVHPSNIDSVSAVRLYAQLVQFGGGEPVEVHMVAFGTQ